jgi:hypothetical protein
MCGRRERCNPDDGKGSRTSTFFRSEKVLEATLQAFRHDGFEGASRAGMTRATDINRASLCAASVDEGGSSGKWWNVTRRVPWDS